MSNFQIEITDDETGKKGSYSVRGSFDSETSKPEIIDFKLPAKIRKDVTLLHSRAAGLGKSNPTAYENDCARVGKFLFSSIFVRDVERLYREYMLKDAEKFKPRLIIRMPRELYRYPWELLADPLEQDAEKKFLAIQGSVIRSDAMFQLPPKVFPQPAPLSFLYFFSSPDDRVIKQVRFQSPYVHEVPDATFVAFKDSLGGSPLAVIFHGHGNVHPPDEPEFGVFNFVDDSGKEDPCNAQAVGQNLEEAPSVRTALVVACDSAWTQGELKFEQTFAGGLFTGTPLDFVVAMQRDVDAIAGFHFLKRLVTSLLEKRQTLDMAIRDGRKAIREISQVYKGQKYSALNWWVPVVYSKRMFFRTLPANEPPPPLPPAPEPAPPAPDLTATGDPAVPPSPEPKSPEVFQNFGQAIGYVLGDVFRRLSSWQ